MKTGLIVFVMLIGAQPLWAQDSQYYRLKGGPDPTKSIPFEQKYSYPAFLRGTLTFKNGNASQAAFNYNRLLGEMHFIGPKGDTLALAEDPTMHSVTLGKETFYFAYPKTFWRVVTSYPTVTLVSKDMLIMIDAEKQGGYGQSTGTSSIRNTTVLSNSNGSITKLIAQSDLLLSKRSELGLMDVNYRFLTPKKSTVLDLFPQKKQEIKRYLQENSVNFSQLDDLQKLLSFCGTND